MAYCVNADVSVYTGLDYSTGSDPTSTAVDSIIDQLSGEIDLHLNYVGIVTPSNADLLQVLKKYLSVGSAGFTIMRYAKNADERAAGQFFYSEYKEWLDKLITDKNYAAALLTLNTGTASTVFVSNQVVDGTYSSSEVSFIDEDFHG